MDLTRSTVKLFGGHVGFVVLTFLGIMYFARELGAAQIGVFFLFQALLSVLVLPANLGTRIALEKRISEADRPGQMLTTGAFLKFGLLVPVVLVVLALSDAIDGYLGMELAIYLAIAIPLQEAAMTMNNVVRGELRVGETAVIELSYIVVWVGVGVVLTSIGFGVVGLVYAVIAGYAVQFGYGFLKRETPFHRPSLSCAQSIVEYAKYSIIPEIDGEIHSWMDVLIIGYLLTQAAVGAYEVAWRISMPVLLTTGAISLAIFPQISAWNADESTASIENVIPAALTPALALVFPAFFGGLLFAPEILGFIFGLEFTIASGALVILLAGKAPEAVQSVIGKALLGIDRPDLVTRAASLDIVLNLAFNIVLITQFGLVGAAIGTTLALTIGTVLRAHYLSRFFTLRIPYRDLGWCLLCSVIMFLVLFGLRTIVEIETLPGLLAAIGFGAVLYCALLVVYKPLRTQIVRQTRAVIS
ncbi:MULTISPECIES: oligosaccharide flippase family protein [Natrialbaceae]|uniref:oligosaccharide flippase family protein n=1 Tax=Natrialbaceae TaxID=1644061 RepID=UPI00207C2FBB|nr:polysaccharide biosynthesis C-terminal domain-containing protein [Natronococcus sp. CG52]